MIYVDTNGDVRYAYEENERLLCSLIQELKLFKNENPLHTDYGIDYIRVFNYEAFLRMEALEVIERHRDKFDNIELGNVTQVDDALEMSVTVTFKDGTISTQKLELL